MKDKVMQKKQKEQREPRRSRELVPLSAEFTLMALVGLIISFFALTYGGLDPMWGVTFLVVFSIMVIASGISILPPWPEELKK